MTTMQTSTLRPGFLVSLKSSIRGNVHYVRRDIETQKKLKNGEAHAKWETERTIADLAEHEAAVKARTAARVAVASVCAYSAFGLLCPEDNAQELDEAVKAASQIVADFNSTATLTRIEIFVMKGKIAQDDVEAVKAINSEVRDLLSTMEQGLKNLDPKSVREAANKAKQLGSMLSNDAEAKVQIAIDAARQSAKAIVKAGEQASFEIDKRAIRKIAEQRTAFLDLSDAKEIETPKAKSRRVAFEASDKKIWNAETKKRRQIEMEGTPAFPDDIVPEN